MVFNTNRITTAYTLVTVLNFIMSDICIIYLYMCLSFLMLFRQGTGVLLKTFQGLIH